MVQLMISDGCLSISSAKSAFLDPLSDDENLGFHYWSGFCLFSELAPPLRILVDVLDEPGEEISGP